MPRISRHSITFKLVLVGLVLLLIIAAVAAWQVRVRNETATAAENMLELSQRSSDLLQQSTMSFGQLRVALRDYVYDGAKREDHRVLFQSLAKQLESLLANLKTSAPSQALTDQVEALEREVRTYTEVGERVISAGAARDIRGATNLLLNESHVAAEVVLHRLRVLATRYAAYSATVLTTTKATNAQATSTMIMLIAFCALGLAVLLSYVFYFLVRPVATVKNEVQRLAKGDFTSTYRGRGKDEWGVLSFAIESTVGNLRQMISSAQSASISVAEKAQLISGSIEEVAAGNESQASITQEISRTLEQLAAATEEIAANAQKAANASNNANTAAKIGTTKVANSIQSLSTVQTSVMNLSSVSKQIGGIVSTIDDISDQTNLLALNAAIEAARAGEHGRGFAVVADAVRSLAEQSRQSTKEITKLISSIQGQIDQAVNISNQGAEGAKGAQEALDNIVEQINTIAGMVEGISAAGQEQAAAANEVAASMENLGTITEEVAASSQESATAGKQLSDLARDLQDAASKFKV